MTETALSDKAPGIRHIPLKDNWRNKIGENDEGRYFSERERLSVDKYAGRKLSDIVKDNRNLLIFPDKIDGTNEDGIGDLPLFTVVGDEIVTGNLVGFFGFDNLRFDISSRFDESEKQNFLYYMLQKVFFPNVVDLSTEFDHLEQMIDILPYIFPPYLLRALRQGVFRQYRYFEFNDDRLRGAVNVAEHIRRNIPFMGKIAYRTREYTANNSLIQLVRHTIEFLRSRTRTKKVLAVTPEVIKGVNFIVDATPDFNRKDLNRVIAQNLRPIRHPFYTEYTSLQKLCLRILRGEQTSFGESRDQVYGILFDAAWLWEEYLATLMPKWITHPQNKVWKGVLKIYKDGERGAFIPDFYSWEKSLPEEKRIIVLDAKYKRKNGQIGEDTFQLISYMHLLKTENGGLIYPKESKEIGETKKDSERELDGYGGNVFTLAFRIPQTDTFEKFSSEIKTSEKELAEILEDEKNLTFRKYGISEKLTWVTKNPPLPPKR